MQSVALALVTLIVAALAPPSAAFRHSAGVAPLRLTAAARHTRASPLRMSDAEPCMEDEEACSVEIMKLFDEVKQRAAEAKALENKLKSLQATEVTIKRRFMLYAVRCCDSRAHAEASRDPQVEASQRRHVARHESRARNATRAPKFLAAAAARHATDVAIFHARQSRPCRGSARHARDERARDAIVERTVSVHGEHRRPRPAWRRASRVGVSSARGGRAKRPVRRTQRDSSERAPRAR